MHKIFCLLSCETFVLIAALLLFAYVKKNDIGKWLQYVAAAIAIFMMVLMIGSVFTCCMPCYQMGGSKHCMMGGGNSCTMGQGGMGNCGMMGGQGNCGMMGGMGNCGPMGGMNDDCCSKGGGNWNYKVCTGEDEEEEDEDDSKDTLKKKVTIKITK